MEKIPSSYQQPENIEDKNIQESRECGIEVMEIPEIKVKKEDGLFLTSLILKSLNPDWGSDEYELAKETTEYFLKNSINRNVGDFFGEIRALKDGGIDEESLFILSLTFNHPEREEAAIATLEKYKPWIKDPRGLHTRFVCVLKEFKDSTIAKELRVSFETETDRDIEQRERRLPQTRERISRLIDFFQPDMSTTPVTRIEMLPTNFLYPKNAGAGFHFGNELVIMSNIDNDDNVDHEFLHSAINPIVEKLESTLTESQKEAVLERTSGRLRENYGEHFFSVLCEEFIRTYNDWFKKSKKPPTVSEFMRDVRGQLLQNKELDDFVEETTGGGTKKIPFTLRLAGIRTMSDWEDDSRRYFNKYKQSDVQNMVYDAYITYTKEREQNPDLNFETFISEKFSRFVQKLLFDKYAPSTSENKP